MGRLLRTVVLPMIPYALCSASWCTPCPTGCSGSASCSDDRLCGPRSLAHVCTELGVYATIDEISRLSGLDSHGTSMSGLLKAAEAKGLHAAGVKMPLTDLLSLQMPAVVHQWGGHFIAIEGIDGSAAKVIGAKKVDSVTERVILADSLGPTYSGFALLLTLDQNALSGLDSRPCSSDRPMFMGAKPPDIRFSDYVWYYGSIVEGESLAHTFEYRNAGELPLSISKVVPECGCTTVVSYTRVVQPGGTGRITLLFNSTGLSKSVQKSLRLDCNDPVTPSVFLTISGYVRVARPGRYPDHLDFGQLRKSETAVRKLYIFGTPVDPTVVSSVSCDVPSIKSEILPSDSVEKPGTLIRVTMAHSSIGRISGVLEVVCEPPKDPISIPLEAVVTAAIRAEPDVIFFGMADGRKPYAVRVSLDGLPNSKLVRGVDYPHDLVTAEVKRGVLYAALNPRAPKGMMRGDVVVRLADPDQPEVRIPIIGYVK